MRFRSDKIKNYALACVHKDNRKFIVICVCLLSVFTVLAYLFPYTGDDWSWGINIGLSRIDNFFYGYNGRYFGNLLVLTLTRSRLLKTILMAISYLLCCLLCCKSAKNNKTILLLFAAFLFFVMPRNIFAQAVVWTSGYSNYVPPALLSAGYIAFVKNSLLSSRLNYSRYMCLLTFILGFIAAPFIENIAIFNIVFGVLVVAYTALKYKKVFAVHAGFLLGAVFGALWMFSNSAYDAVSAGEDSYRSIPYDFISLIKYCFSNGYTICNNVVISNVAVCLIVSVLLLLIALKSCKQSKNKLLLGAVVLNVLSVAAFVCKRLFLDFIDTDNSVISIVLKSAFILVALLYVSTVIAVLIICIDKKRCLGFLLVLLCVPLSVVPLIVVNPLGGRCFFFAHLLIMIFVVDLFEYSLQETVLYNIDTKVLTCGFTAVTAVLSIVFISIYAQINSYDKARIEFAKLQTENNESRIAVCELPYPEFIHTPNPHSEIWAERFRPFYGLNTDAEIEIVSIEYFNQYRAEYTGKES